MKRRGQIDVAVGGGGVVGAACALVLAREGLEVMLVEGREPPRWSPSQLDLRVYAFAPDNAALLDAAGVWDAVRDARAQPYRRMRVWDATGGDELRFDADALGRTQLGWIVENALLVDRLWAALPAAGVQVRCPARVEAMQQDADGVTLRLDDGTRIDARLAVAADGGDSTLRRLAGLEVTAHDYAQRGVVAFVCTGEPHEDTAWQRFLPSGPLAFLPFADGLSSIVWTLPDAEAERVLALDEASFGRELTQAMGGQRGEVALASPRAAFPLKRQLARDYVAGRVIVAGDAAHVVHPLAGQGVNLGLRDVAALRDGIRAATAKRADWDAPHRLERWARQRRSENATAAHAFDGINRLFSNDEMHLTLLRGPLLGLAGKLPPLVDFFWRHAAGQRGR
ncbi:UbiH/UbiF family hydroxylase [Pseudoxanthomonas mexicana]|uniref:UbiH/UbiF family hydroxylase n=1 Tax=Pseudoxanthomonas mexicana TaxID=128785 RepID=A0A7G9TGW3_PSEMX|nr:UbiH/UbiF family hydroxylase [Pseudoxanthomonas mexicana]QNN79338.1 UbiH/UbiF family hydroxylase [Pseudoxanthomonas mexicana]